MRKVLSWWTQVKRSWLSCSNSFTSTSCKSLRLVLTAVKSSRHPRPSSTRCTLRWIVLTQRNLQNWISQPTLALRVEIVNYSLMLCRQAMATSGRVRMSLRQCQPSSFWSCISIWTGLIKSCTLFSSLRTKTQLMRICLLTFQRVTAQLKLEWISQAPPPRKSQSITTNQLRTRSLLESSWASQCLSLTTNSCTAKPPVRATKKSFPLKAIKISLLWAKLASMLPSCKHNHNLKHGARAFSRKMD